MAVQSTGDSKLIQYLNEAYGTESRLETALQEHITMAIRPGYRKRLKDHLGETKRHAREVKQAIRRLGGSAETISTPGPQPITDVAEAVVGGAQKAVALAQGPLHMLRGTGPEEKQLKNAKTEYASEAEEIATYTAIASLADTLGNSEVRQLARTILREEQRMSGFLEKEIARLTSAVAKAEVPAAERRTNGRASKRSSAKRSGSTSAKRSGSASAKRSGSASAKRSGSASAKRTSSASAKRSSSTSAKRSISASAKRSSASTPAKARTSAKAAGRKTVAKASSRVRKAGSASSRGRVRVAAR